MPSSFHLTIPDDNEINFSQNERWNKTQNHNQIFDLNNLLNSGEVKTLDQNYETSHFIVHTANTIQTDY